MLRKVGEVEMTDAENAIIDLETQIRWIRDNEHHQFPGWMNTIMAMEQAIRLIEKTCTKYKP